MGNTVDNYLGLAAASACEDEDTTFRRFNGCKLLGIELAHWKPSLLDLRPLRREKNRLLLFWVGHGPVFQGEARAGLGETLRERAA